MTRAGTHTDVEAWRPRLIELCDGLREAARGALFDAQRSGTLDALARPVAQGAGDLTFGIDVPTEDVLTSFLERNARHAPLSLLTEDAGWRHMGPAANGRAIELDGFDHGGPRIVVDPIDGTRNLMSDVRSAWSVVALAPAGATQPSLSDVELGVLAEIPDTRAAHYRVLHARRTQRCRFELRQLADRALLNERELDAAAGGTAAARADHGYFPFFKYMADMRPTIAAIEARFFERLATHEGADVRSCYDDQYISNGGQLALLALGTYRMIADLRQHLARARGSPTLTSKPYDIAGAVVCARAAGCVITAADGTPLDFPLDAHTPIGFVGWTNEATRARLEPHLRAALSR